MPERSAQAPGSPGRAARGFRLNEGNRRWWTLGAMCFALFMIMLDSKVWM